MIKKLSIIFGSKMKAQEIILLLNDMKPVIRQGYYPSELPKIKKYCDENNLFCITSNFKVLLADDTQYSNKGMRISESDPRPGMYFVYISKEEETALLAAYFELMNNQKDFGLTLGYPKCCVHYFIENFSLQNANPHHHPTNHYTNLTQRENDACLLSHFPCNSDCEESIKMAQQFHQTIMSYDKEHAYWLIDQLNTH